MVHLRGGTVCRKIVGPGSTLGQCVGLTRISCQVSGPLLPGGSVGVSRGGGGAGGQSRRAGLHRYRLSRVNRLVSDDLLAHHDVPANFSSRRPSAWTDRQTRKGLSSRDLSRYWGMPGATLSIWPRKGHLPLRPVERGGHHQWLIWAMPPSLSPCARNARRDATGVGSIVLTAMRGASPLGRTHAILPMRTYSAEFKARLIATMQSAHQRPIPDLARKTLSPT